MFVGEEARLPGRAAWATVPGGVPAAAAPAREAESLTQRHGPEEKGPGLGGARPQQTAARGCPP